MANIELTKTLSNRPDFRPIPMENNGINISDFDGDIYRVFSLGRFKQLLKTSQLGLVNPSMWDDPFENFFLKANVVESDSSVSSLENLYKSWYGQCWTYTRESDAIWRIYGGESKQGVRVKTNIRKLFSSFWNEADIHSRNKYYIGAVKYHSRNEIEELMRKTSFLDVAIGGRNHVFAELLCVKRLEFAHEDEVRLLYNDLEGFEDGRVYNKIIKYNEVFEEVCIDPRIALEEYKLIKGELISLGCEIPITQSDLYRVEFEPIRLM